MRLFTTTCCLVANMASAKTCDLVSEGNPLGMRVITNRGKTKYNKSDKYQIRGNIDGLKKWGETPLLDDETTATQITVKCKGKNILDKDGNKAKSIFDGYLTITAKDCFKSTVLDDIDKLCTPKPSTCYMKNIPSYYGLNARGDCTEESYKDRKSCLLKQCDNDKKSHKIKCDCSSGTCQWLAKPAKTWGNASTLTFAQNTCIDCSMKMCATVSDPVCGSDGNTYSNECFFEIAQCNDPSLEIDHKGQCSQCGGMCTADWDPVCGSNGKTYSNKCKFDIAACEDDTLTMKNGACVGPQASCPIPDADNGHWECTNLAAEGYITKGKSCTLQCDSGFHPNKVGKPAEPKCAKRQLGGGKPLPVCIKAGCGEIHNMESDIDGDWFGMTHIHNIYVDADGNEVNKNTDGVYPIGTINKPKCPDPDTPGKNGWSQANIYDGGAVACVRGPQYNNGPSFIWSFDHGGKAQDVNGCINNKRCLEHAKEGNQGFQNCLGWFHGSSGCKMMGASYDDPKGCSGAAVEAIETGKWTNMH